MQTELGRIAHLLATAEEIVTPLQRRLAQVSQTLLYICGGIVASVAVAGLLRGWPLMQVFMAAVSLAVAAVPEGLPAVVTIALAVGVQRMAARNVLVRRLPAVETLGCATVICTDKTGTLTTGVMRVRELWGRDHGDPAIRRRRLLRRRDRPQTAGRHWRSDGGGDPARGGRARDSPCRDRTHERPRHGDPVRRGVQADVDRAGRRAGLHQGRRRERPAAVRGGHRRRRVRPTRRWPSVVCASWRWRSRRPAPEIRATLPRPDRHRGPAAHRGDRGGRCRARGRHYDRDDHG